MTRLLDVWPPLPPGAWLRRPERTLPFPLGSHGCTLFARARHALRHAVPALGLEPGDELLVPAYHHGSEVEALVRAGLECRFYDGDGALAPDEAELEALLGPRTRALYLVHYLGFPQESARWRGWCDERGLLLVEDAAQAWGAERDGIPAGALADAAVYCLYKTVGVPDGAALHLRAGRVGPRGEPSLGAAGAAKRHFAWLAARVAPAGRLLARARAGRAVSPGRDLALGEPDSRPSRATAFLLPRLRPAAAVRGRRERYARLAAALGSRVPAPFDRLPDGAAPFALPLDVDDRRATLAALLDAGVAALDLWSRPHPGLPAGFPDAERRRARTIALPVHQELSEADVEAVARAAAG